MKRAYVDTSVLVALHFREPPSRGLFGRLKRFDELVSATLCLAEVLAALRREGRRLGEADGLLARISFFAPDGPLRAECEEALLAGMLRGADLWHVAAALALAGPRQRQGLVFLTLDTNQAAVAAALGFPVVP